VSPWALRNSARAWRACAQDARDSAFRATDVQIRQCLLQIAETWERMAVYEATTGTQDRV